VIANRDHRLGYIKRASPSTRHSLSSSTVTIACACLPQPLINCHLILRSISYKPRVSPIVFSVFAHSVPLWQPQSSTTSPSNNSLKQSVRSSTATGFWTVNSHVPCCRSSPRSPRCSPKPPMAIEKTLKLFPSVTLTPGDFSAGPTIS
jgi:hypothetical protein